MGAAYTQVHSIVRKLWYGLLCIIKNIIIYYVVLTIYCAIQLLGISIPIYNVYKVCSVYLTIIYLTYLMWVDHFSMAIRIIVPKVKRCQRTELLLINTLIFLMTHYIITLVIM